MVLTGALLLGLFCAWVILALVDCARLGLEPRQALFYAPFKLLYRIDDSGLRGIRNTQPPVIYVIWHQSRIEPALMLSLLPSDTLHILDEASARASWLDPWRGLARTIAFNAEHVFVSRRLVRVLKGKGRLAVYLPDTIEPDLKSFRLFRAVARIALQADAKVVPIFVSGTRHLPFSLTDGARARRALLPKLRVTALEGMTIPQLLERSGSGQTRNAHALFDRFMEARLLGFDPGQTLFQATRDAALRHGPASTIIEDPVTGAMSYREMLIAARVLGRRFESVTAPGDVVGVMLPNSNGFVLSMLALTSCARPAAMINYTSGPANVASALKTAVVRTVISSHAFIEKAGLADIVSAAEAAGARFLWLEDVRAQVSLVDKLAGAAFWRFALQRQDATKPAFILFTSGSEGLPKAVVLSNRNIVANAMQAEARLTVSPADKLLNVLPVFHSFGLTAGVVLPLLTGAKLFLYPSPLHYKLIPDVARRIRPTVMISTDTFLAAYARTAEDEDFSSLRFVVAGAEPVRQETRRVYRERFHAEVVEGYGVTEAAPVVAVNSATHNREGSVGRVLPGMRLRLEAVEGISEGVRLWVTGPNVMMGYMNAERPGVLQPLPDAWHDTGDIVSIDKEGFIFIRGRAKRFAKVAGEMVSLGAVEMLAQALWPEERHAVVAVPDAKRGERIVLVTTATQAGADALRRQIKQAGAAELMLPQDIVKVAELPVLGSGKTDYVATRALAIERLSQPA